MTLRLSISLALFALPFSLFSAQSMYCPENHRYINVGMTVDQVIAACGQPIAQQESKQPIFKKVPVQQLIYNNQGTSTAFYGVWNIPTGSGGTPVQVDVIDGVVRNVNVNGSDSNSFSVCRGNSIQVGDRVGKVFGACGSPDVVNNTFINEPIQTEQKPQIWIYQPGQYQPSFSLTFVDGKLQSINN